jgi:hypothetical protein
MTRRTATRYSLATNTRLTQVTMTAVLAVAMVATSVGCGQTNPTAPTPPIPPSSSSPGPVPTNTVPAANNGEVGVYTLDVTMSLSGTARVTLTWPNADFSLQLYVTSGNCADTARLVTGGCTILGSTRPGTLPGVVTGPVTGGDRYTIWVLNPDPAPQGFMVDVDNRDH